MVVRFALAAACLLGACIGGEPPDILSLDDQVAIVGQQFTLELDGVDPDGQRLSYSVKADISLAGNASITQMPSGVGVFRWTPVASDVGSHIFDFIVSDGQHDTTVSITIDVRSGVGIPIFRQPLGSGMFVNLKSSPCMSLDIVVEDANTAQVTIAQEPPLIPGAELTQNDGTTATWHWCPGESVLPTDRYTLVLSADDGENTKTIKDYVLVLSSSKPPRLVINEVDYDNVGTDTHEYVELFNASGASMSLVGLELALINGATGSDYGRIDLSPISSLGPHKYLVIAGSSVTVPSTALKLDPLWTQDELQNGAPDGIAIVDTITHSVIDALSYEGAITSATIATFPAPISLVEGTELASSVADSNTVNGSLCRYPNGQDTNDARADWRFCGTPSLGNANSP